MHRYNYIFDSSDSEEEQSKVTSIVAQVHESAVEPETRTASSEQNVSLTCLGDISISDSEEKTDRGATSGDIEEKFKDVFDSKETQSIAAKNVEELFKLRKDDLDLLALQSPYSKFSKVKRISKFDDIRNILSSVHKVKDRGNQKAQNEYRNKVYPHYNALREANFPAKTISQLLDEAVKITKSLKPEKSKITNYFKTTSSGDGSPSTSSARNSEIAPSRDSAEMDFVEEIDKSADIETVLSADGENQDVAETPSLNQLIKQIIRPGEAFTDYDKVPELTVDKLAVEQLIKKTVDYKKQLKIFLDRKVYSLKKSKIQFSIDKVEAGYIELCEMMKSYNNTATTMDTDITKSKTIAEKIYIAKSMEAGLKEKKMKIADKILELNIIGDIEETKLLLKRRNQTQESRIKAVQPASYYESYCAKNTWQETISKLEADPPTFKSVKLDIDMAINIKKAMEENGFLKLPELVDATGLHDYEASTIRKLALHNLPIIAIKSKADVTERLVDVRQFLQCPSLMIEMWQAQEHTKVK